MMLALAGGVGGARLVRGLTRLLSPSELKIVVNTGDDFTHLGLHVAPDPDTVMYHLAELNDPVRGWGRKDESWAFLDSLKILGGPDWFQLGDRDLALHVARTEMLRVGLTQSQALDQLRRAMAIAHTIIPMSDDPAPTLIATSIGPLAFQDYFVRHRCEPAVEGIRYGAETTAAPASGFIEALADPLLQAVIICPSNPLLSIAPILALKGVEEWLSTRRVPVIVVAPLVGGRAIKGPLGKIMGELGMPVSVPGLLTYYGERIDAMLIDPGDGDGIPSGASPRLFTADIMMQNEQKEEQVAGSVLRAVKDLRADKK